MEIGEKIRHDTIKKMKLGKFDDTFKCCFNPLSAKNRYGDEDEIKTIFIKINLLKSL